MASLTDIIQQRVIQKKYEALPEWLRWVLFLPLTIIISVIASILTGGTFPIIAIGNHYGRIYDLQNILISIPLAFVVLNCVFYSFYFFSPRYKSFILLTVCSVVLSYFIYSFLWIIKDNLLVIRDLDLLSKLILRLLIPASHTLIIIYILKNILSPRKRLVDIGTNLNREEDVKGSLLY